MRRFIYCPRCKSELRPTLAINGGESKNWKKCTRCNTFVNTYIPQPHQEAVHRDPHTYIGNFGGYGTGKTTTSRQEVYKHILITPNANILVCANVQSQYEQTIKREFEEDFPLAFVRSISVQKQQIDFINGARLMFRPLDDPDKLRSLNLTMFVILEASETDDETFTQLKTRLRNTAAAVQAIDEKGFPVTKVLDNGAEVPVWAKHWAKGIVESNPGPGWIRTDLLYVASEVHKHGDAIAEFTVPEHIKDYSTSVHVASTDVNKYLPDNFIQQICKNKPMWWIARYVLSSFDYAEGLVYPHAPKCVIPAFPIPSDWKRIIACDYGLSDKFTFLALAINEKEGKVFAYKNKATKDKNIEDLARMFKEFTEDIPIGGWYTQPILDPKSGAKRDYNKKTLYSHFADYGIMFKPGHVQLEARIFRLNTYLESGRLFIFDTCEELVDEIKEYRYPERTLSSSEKTANKPVDKNNHSINPLEWACMELPSDPSKLVLGSFDRYGRSLDVDIVRDRDDKPVVWQLADVETYTENDYEGDW